MKLNRLLAVACLLSGLTLSACTQISGVVIDDRTKKPVPTAVFSVGRPDGLGSFAKYPVDKEGKFDFQIFMGDENYIYVWDDKSDPRLTLQHIDRNELRKNMVVRMQPSPGAILSR